MSPKVKILMGPKVKILMDPKVKILMGPKVKILVGPKVKILTGLGPWGPGPMAMDPWARASCWGAQAHGPWAHVAASWFIK